MSVEGIVVSVMGRNSTGSERCPLLSSGGLSADDNDDDEGTLRIEFAARTSSATLFERPEDDSIGCDTC